MKLTTMRHRISAYCAISILLTGLGRADLNNDQNKALSKRAVRELKSNSQVEQVYAVDVLWKLGKPFAPDFVIVERDAGTVQIFCFLQGLAFKEKKKISHYTGKEVMRKEIEWNYPVNLDSDTWTRLLQLPLQSLISPRPAVYFPQIQGGVTEWLKVQHWKCCVPYPGTVGSNPTPSASLRLRLSPDGGRAPGFVWLRRCLWRGRETKGTQGTLGTIIGTPVPLVAWVPFVPLTAPDVINLFPARRKVTGFHFLLRKR